MKNIDIEKYIERKGESNSFNLVLSAEMAREVRENAGRLGISATEYFRTLHRMYQAQREAE